jgi:hypothetical protein
LLRSACLTTARATDRSWRFLIDQRLVAFAISATLFHLANAAMLPIAAAAVTKRAGSEAGLIIAVCIVGPQLVTALLSPWAGRAAEAWGRRPILLLGFSALPIASSLFSAAFSLCRRTAHVAGNLAALALHPRARLMADSGLG